jgi:hypothetical protein
MKQKSQYEIVISVFSTYYSMNKAYSWTEAQQIIRVCGTYFINTYFNDIFYVLPIDVAANIVAHKITTMNSTWSILYTL